MKRSMKSREASYGRVLRPLVRLPPAAEKVSINSITRRINNILAAVQDKTQNVTVVNDLKSIPLLSLSKVTSARSNAVSTGRARPLDLTSLNTSADTHMQSFRSGRGVHSTRHSDHFDADFFTIDSRHHHAVSDPLSAFRSLPQPVSGTAAIQHVKAGLTAYEQTEIVGYPEVYFLGLQSMKCQDATFQDEKGNYKVVLGDHIAYRYEVLEPLGRGSFGQVLKVLDHKTKEMLALKIIRNKKRFVQQATVEARILKHLTAIDQDDSRNVVHVRDCFAFRKHPCFTFELLSHNLYDFLKFNGFQGLSMTLLKRLAGQILVALQTLAACSVVHCDLKPENILLRHPKKASVKLIDFGSSCYQAERLYTYIQSRYYRAPEIILGIPYTAAIDMWSFGCICAELLTGRPLFPGESEQDQLARIVQVKGLPPRSVQEQASRRKLFFDSQGLPRVGSQGQPRAPGSRSLAEVLKTSDALFLDFVESRRYVGCTEWDPEDRMKASEAVNHDWLSDNRARSTVRSHMRNSSVLGSGVREPQQVVLRITDV